MTYHIIDRVPRNTVWWVSEMKGVASRYIGIIEYMYGSYDYD